MEKARDLIDAVGVVKIIPANRVGIGFPDVTGIALRARNLTDAVRNPYRIDASAVAGCRRATAEVNRTAAWLIGRSAGVATRPPSTSRFDVPTLRQRALTVHP